jgi:hypothetical protein
LSFIIRQKENVHPADIREWLHVSDLYHNRLFVVGADRNTGLEEDIRTGLSSELAFG